MFDNQLISLIIDTIIEQETIAGIPGTPIKQAFQPTLQGVNTKPTAYMYKIADHPYGFPYVSDRYSNACSSMIHTESQQYETTFQISTLATQNPKTPTQYTASDICNLIRYCLQSAHAVATLQAQGVGIERVTQVRNPYFFDDRYQNEACPSFDFVLTHKQTIVSTSPVITETEFIILTV